MLHGQVLQLNNAEDCTWLVHEGTLKVQRTNLDCHIGRHPPPPCQICTNTWLKYAFILFSCGTKAFCAALRRQVFICGLLFFWTLNLQVPFSNVNAD
jgi:hypothetical protein